MATNGKKGANVRKGKETSKKHTQTGQKISDEKSMTRGTSKQAMLIKLLERPGGATIDEMVKTTGWQQHSIRGGNVRCIEEAVGALHHFRKK